MRIVSCLLSRMCGVRGVEDERERRGCCECGMSAKRGNEERKVVERLCLYFGVVCVSDSDMER